MWEGGTNNVPLESYEEDEAEQEVEIKATGSTRRELAHVFRSSLREYY
jgi:hypothetical protein